METKSVWTIKYGFVKREEMEVELIKGRKLEIKQRNVQILHDAIGLPCLECSSISQDEFVKAIQFSNLRIGTRSFEDVFKESELRSKSKDGKKGNILFYKYAGWHWNLNHLQDFQDFLFAKAIQESFSREEVERKLAKYEYFTDIDFKEGQKETSIARSLAIVKLMYKLFDGILDTDDREHWCHFLELFVKG